MAYGYPYTQPPVPGYFNTNYMPQMQIPQQMLQAPQTAQSGLTLMQVPDELTARNAQFPMDGSPVFFIHSNGSEIYSKQLSLANGSVIFHRYKQEEDQADQSPKYVTQDELEAKFNEIYQLIGAATAPEGGTTK